MREITQEEVEAWYDNLSPERLKLYTDRVYRRVEANDAETMEEQLAACAEVVSEMMAQDVLDQLVAEGTIKPSVVNADGKVGYTECGE